MARGLERRSEDYDRRIAETRTFVFQPRQLHIVVDIC